MGGPPTGGRGQAAVDADADAERLWPRLRPVLTVLLALYVAFVVYGSLVPLQPSWLPPGEAWQRFVNTGWADSAHLSRTDLAVNVALTVPLALLLRAWLHQPRAPAAVQATLSLVTWLLCAALSVAVEYMQVHFPARSHALSDVAAQWAGAAIGLALYAWRGAALRHWATGWWTTQQGQPMAVWLLQGWLLALMAAALVPLDLTISPVEIYHKWQQGRIHWLPLADLPAAPLDAAWQLASDALLWAPVGVLWRLRGRTPLRAAGLGLAAALLIEVLQLFVFSRVSSSSDVLMGGLGAWLGALCCPGRVSAAQAGQAGQAGSADPKAAGGQTTTAQRPRRAWTWLLGWLAWLLLLPLAYWYPYQFDLNSQGLATRLHESLTRLPFEALFYSTEQRAVTEILRKLLMFVPGGLLWAAWQAHRPASSRHTGAWWLLLAAALACLIELGQVALPGKVADATDAALGLFGAWLGLLAGRRLWATRLAPPLPPAAPMPHANTWPVAPPMPEPPPRPAAQPVRPPPQATLAQSAAWLGLRRADALSVLALAAVLWLAARLPGVPYNLKELLPASLAGGLAAAAVAALLSCGLTLPLLLAQRWQRQPERATLLVLLLPLLGLPGALALLWGVPRESLHDVVGSPVLGWPAGLELVGRACALLSALALAALGAAWAVLRLASPAFRGLLPRWWLVVLVWLLPLHALVVAWAATDNLTELMRGGGSLWASACLGLGVTAVLLGCNALAAAAAGAPHKSRLLASVALAWPLGSLALWLGSEPWVMKYGQVFSAAQFLLSSDRAHLAAPAQLLARWGTVLLALSLVCGVLQWSRWRGLEPLVRSQHSSRARRQRSGRSPVHRSSADHPPG